MRKKELKFIIGASGVGKNFLCSVFGLSSIPSYTTRAKRNNEIDGVEHKFVSKDYYNFMKRSQGHDLNNKTLKHKEKMIIAETEFAGNFYWATLDQLEDESYDVYIIDPDGMYYFLRNFSKQFNRKFSIIYLEASLIRRIINMRKRGDSLKNIFKRIVNDRKIFSEFKNNKLIDKVIVKL